MVAVIATLGNRAFKAKNYERAILYSTMLTFLNPVNGKIFHGRGVYYRANGQLDLAIKDFESSIARNKNFFPSYYCLLATLCEQKRVEEFLPHADQVVRFLPHNAESYNIRGTYFAYLERYRDALANFDKALELSPSNPGYITNQAWTIYKLGRVQDAIEIYKEILNESTVLQQAYINYSQILIEQKDYESALSYANQLLTSYPESSFGYYLRAFLLRKLKDYVSAMQDVEKSIRMESVPDYYIERGSIYFCLDNFPQALEDYSYAIERISPRSCAFVDRGYAYVNIDRIDEAHADALKAYELEADSKYAISLLALTRFIRGEMDEAKALWREMVELDARYMDMTWTAEELGWRGRLVSEGEKLIASL